MAYYALLKGDTKQSIIPYVDDVILYDFIRTNTATDAFRVMVSAVQVARMSNVVICVIQIVWKMGRRCVISWI
jgi:hypothetical protein